MNEQSTVAIEPPTILDHAIPHLTRGQRWRTLILCLLGWLFDHYDMMLFGFLAAAIGRDWHWGDQFKQNKATLIGIALFTSGIGGVAFGGLADRFGRRRVMGWTILIYSISTGLSGIATGFV